MSFLHIYKPTGLDRLVHLIFFGCHFTLFCILKCFCHVLNSEHMLTSGFIIICYFVQAFS